MRFSMWHRSRVMLTSGLVGLLAVVGDVTQGLAQNDALVSAPSRFAILDGARIHYKSLGVGRAAAVLVHCWACDMNMWQAQVPVLEGRVRIIAIDLPGHGRSDKPALSYTMAHFARAVNAVLEAAGVEQAYLVGHSMGVPVAREFLRLFPRKSAGFVAVDGWLVSPVLGKEAIDAQLKRIEGSDLGALFAEMINPMFPGSDQASIRQQVLRTAIATPKHVVQSAMRGMLDASIWRDEPIAVPLLVVVAKNGTWPADYRARVQRLNADVDFEELEGVHHFLMLERPDLFNPLLVQFLRGLGALAG